MPENILAKIKKLSEDLPKGSETIRYTDKPFFNDLKRVLRIAKKVSNKDKPRKIGYFLQEAKKVKGSDKNKEEIIRKIFGKAQEMPTSKFIEKLYDYASEEFPKGELLLVKPETAYQTTQRMIPDAKLNRTLSTSLFGEILVKPLKEFMKEHPEFDEMYRQVHKFVSASGHFQDSAAFVRYTLMTEDWLHFDAFQTDYFNKLRKALHTDSEKNNKLVNEFIKTLESKEFDFFKTAVSYIVRVNPKVKVFTASTADIVQRVEKVRGSGKLTQLYYRLPKALGFKLVPIEKVIQIFETRPGAKAEAKKKLLKKGLKAQTVSVNPIAIKNILKKINESLVERKEKKVKVEKHNLDSIIIDVIDSELSHDQDEEKQVLVRAFHQILDNIFDAFQKSKEEMSKYLLDDKTSKEVKKHTKPKTTGKETELWWANRETIFEGNERDAILRMIM